MNRLRQVLRRLSLFHKSQKAPLQDSVPLFPVRLEAERCSVRLAADPPQSGRTGSTARYLRAPRGPSEPTLVRHTP
ncbi:unnamed protein product [Boreogadus saida]